MKKILNSALLLLALVLFLAGNSRHVLAATTSGGNTVSQITPQDADASGEQVYKTKLVTGPNGYYEVIPVQVSTPGVLVMKATGVATGRGVGISLHSGADATTANRLTYNYLYSTASTAERNIKLEKKGTYYLRVETTDSTYNAGMEQEIDFSLRIYPASKTLKSGKTYRVGQAVNGFQYYTLKVGSNGYIRVNLKKLGSSSYTYSFYVNLFSSKEKAYNSNYALLKDGSLVFAVKKGTYKIGVRTSNELYSVKATFKKYTDQAGASKKKAKTIKKGKSAQGMVLPTDKTSKSDWFKFTLSKAAKPKLIFTTEMALGNLKFRYYSGKNKSYITTVYADDDKKSQTEIQLGAGISAKGKLPKGTYYVQVLPSEKGTSGIYSIKLKY